MFSLFSSSLSKHDLRAHYRRKRDALRDGEREMCAQQVADHLCASFPTTQESVVAVYYPMGGELSLLPFVERLRVQSVCVALPVIVKENMPLQFSVWDVNKPLVKSAYVPVQEPALDAVAVIPDVIYVPLVAFDRKGTRLGQGGGYYDRTLFGLRRYAEEKGCLLTVVGVGYACQEAKKLPVDESDEKLDYMVTEKEILSFV